MRKQANPKSRTPEYQVFRAMLQRCYNIKCEVYERYGGRGIAVCDRWRLVGFDAFISDVGPRPTPKHSIDRKDNDKGYWCGKPECAECGPAEREPNCRWATQVQQNRNRSSNRTITSGDVTLTLAGWAERLGLPSATLATRLREGLSPEEALVPGYLPCDYSNTMKGEGHVRAKLTDDSVREIRRRRSSGESSVTLAREFFVDRSTISHIAARRYWKHVT